MKTLLALCMLCAVTTTGFATEIRVWNDSDVDFEDVVVGSKQYGKITHGAATGYQTWKQAYESSSVSLVVARKRMQIQSSSSELEDVLGNGNFTYVITLQNGRLYLRAEKDKKVDAFRR